MNLQLIDWVIIILIFSVLVTSLFISKKLMHSVADFLAAGRTGGRYLQSIAGGAAGLGAITIVGLSEIAYISGFVLTWWNFIMAVFVLIVTVSGWVIYRFRQTRALTMAQFFEIRYSRKFRIFAGILAYFSGIINMGIFPAVSARFLIYFCGLPEYVNLLGINFSTNIILMLLVIFIPMYFTLSGGHISIMITDFFQGIFMNVVLVSIVILLLLKVNWDQIFTAMSLVPENASLINPFKASNIKDYNFWYFFVGIIGVFYATSSWQGTQAYNVSAKSAHESKMSNVLNNWRGIPQAIFLLFVPIAAYTVMHHSDFGIYQTGIQPVLDTVGNNALKNQLIVPLVLTKLLPAGLIGAFAAVMFAATIACHAPYLHSWGTIFIQDVVMPIRQKPFAPKEHIRYLKYSIFGVGAFIFFFSLLFQQTEYIFLFLPITAAIFVGGSGAVIVGGLYWKRGTTAGAWAAMLTGAFISVGGIIVQQLIPDFPINGQVFYGISMVGAVTMYILVSLSGKKKEFDMNKMLHRGKYEIKEEVKIITEVPEKGWKVLGMGREFTKFDKFLYILTYSWTGLWIIIFIIGTIYNLTNNVSNSSWMEFWKIFVWINVAISVIVVIGFSIGGFKDLNVMIKKLKSIKRDHTDSGFVSDQNIEETNIRN